MPSIMTRPAALAAYLLLAGSADARVSIATHRTVGVSLVQRIAMPGDGADGADFIRLYLDAKGGCRRSLAPLLMFDAGLRARPGPFGKAAERWTQGDLTALKQTMIECVARPNRFDLAQEAEILKRAADLVDEARQGQAAHERQQTAARQLAEERQRQHQEELQQAREAAERREDDARRRAEEQTHQQQEADGMRELQGFYGHVMTPVEVERAQQLRQSLPALAPRVDGLLGAQERLKQEAENQRSFDQARKDAAVRLAQEQQRRRVAEQRAAEEAELEAEAKARAFASALPASCKGAAAAEAELQSKAVQDRAARADSLAEAGDQAGACEPMKEITSKLEALRAKLVQCTKDLDRLDDPLARQASTEDMARAIEIHRIQKISSQRITEMHCE